MAIQRPYRRRTPTDFRSSGREFMLQELERIEEAFRIVVECINDDNENNAITDITVTSAGPVGAPRVIIDAGSGALPADNTELGDGDQVLGISVNSVAAAGEQVQVRTSGRLDVPGASFTPGLPVYTGPSGTLTQVPPSAPGALWTKTVGHATGPEQLFIEIGPTIFLCD